MNFFKAAARLAGVAGWLLGWRPDEFWRATPAELEAVLRAARGEEAPAAGMDARELERLRAVMPDQERALPFLDGARNERPWGGGSRS
ncbi:phage tail assembly chaperone [Sphingobium mellinum]|uniref:phage tail assembly chaperone n=1 Tax=Sphingobium mellinum TaxID=1387166 RepID=UPI0030EE42D5